MPSSRAHKQQKGAAIARAQRAMRRQYADGGDVQRNPVIEAMARAYSVPFIRETMEYIPQVPRRIGEAVTGMATELGNAARRLDENSRGYQPGDPAKTRQMAEDSFTVASTIPVAGLAAGAVRPGVSLGSGGGRLGKSLPMDEASRMARAREMGFDLPAYHATAAEFTEFNPGFRGASFFSDNPAAAEKGATGGAADRYGTAKPTDRIMPVMLRSKNIAGLNLTPKERTWWESLPDRADEQFVTSLQKPSHKIRYWWDVYDEVPNNDGTYSYVKKPVPSKTLDDVRRTGTDVYNDKYIGSYEGEQYMAKTALEDGMDGFILSDEAGIGIGIADPRRIRSVNAAFDPAKIDSANILAANTGRASAPGLGALESNRVRRIPDYAMVEYRQAQKYLDQSPTGRLANQMRSLVDEYWRFNPDGSPPPSPAEHKAAVDRMFSTPYKEPPPKPFEETLEIRRNSKQSLHDIAQSNFNDYELGRSVEMVPIDTLSGGYHWNKRVEPLAAQIKENGWFEPIVIDQNGNVIEGQHRLRAMQSLGVARVPAQRIIGLDDQ